MSCIVCGISWPINNVPTISRQTQSNNFILHEGNFVSHLARTSLHIHSTCVREVHILVLQKESLMITGQNPALLQKKDSNLLNNVNIHGECNNQAVNYS